MSLPKHILDEFEIGYKSVLLDAWMKLSDRERFILSERYSGDKPISRTKIAPRIPRNDGSGKIGVSRDRMWEIENVAIRKMKHAIWTEKQKVKLNEFS